MSVIAVSTRIALRCHRRANMQCGAYLTPAVEKSETVRKYKSCDLNKEERAMRRSKWTSAFQQDESGLGFWRRVVVVIVISVGLIGAATITGAQAQVFPLDSSPYGNTYGEWNARWWQWL